MNTKYTRPPVTPEVLADGQKIVELLTEANTLAQKHYHTGLATHSLTTKSAMEAVLHSQQRLRDRVKAEAALPPAVPVNRHGKTCEQTCGVMAKSGFHSALCHTVEELREFKQ